MGFILEEWTGDDETGRYRTYPIFVGPFATRQEADVEAKKQQPQYGGWIEVVRESSPQAKTARKRTKKKPRNANRRGGGTRGGHR